MSKRKMIITAIVTIVLAIVTGAIFGTTYKQEDVEQITSSVETIVNTIDNIVEENDVIVSEQTEELVIQTKEALNSSGDISTTEIIEGSEDEEQELEEEKNEKDAQIEQENISYNGDNSGTGLSLLSKYPGLTYYSQADSRWANVMYSSTGDTSQTMKSSACGPTSAAMVVSSSKGAILPTTMAQLAVDNGYRTANSGTAWSYFSFVADYFDFKEYYSTGNFDKAMGYLSKKNSDGSSKYYIIASCGVGLFTSGGHYIVLVADNNETITIHDPYLYSRKIPNHK